MLEQLHLFSITLRSQKDTSRMHQPLLKVDFVSLEHLFSLKDLVLSVVLWEPLRVRFHKFFLFNLMMIAGSTTSKLFLERQFLGWRFFAWSFLVFGR